MTLQQWLDQYNEVRYSVEDNFSHYITRTPDVTPMGGMYVICDLRYKEMYMTLFALTDYLVSSVGSGGTVWLVERTT